MLDVEGGNPWLPVIGAYQMLLNKIESNPQDYTWTMDWYYR